jgi:hypothetical protein
MASAARSSGRSTVVHAVRPPQLKAMMAKPAKVEGVRMLMAKKQSGYDAVSL